MKKSKRLFCLLLAVCLMLSVLSPVFAAEEPTDFEQTDRPVQQNATDSSKLPTPTRELELSDVYGQNDTTNADTLTSLISDEAWDLLGEDMDSVLDFEPVGDSAVSKVLAGVDRFVSDGGVETYLQTGLLQATSSFTLSENADDKVQVLGTDTNASGWIYVVAPDALCFVVQDSDGVGIPNALVTISYLDGNNRVTRSVVATAGHVPGIAAFENIPEHFYGILDVQAEGYRAVTILDRYMESGGQYTIRLTESKSNELYIRGVDLSGKDLVNEDTELRLVDMDTEDLTLKVLVTKTGNAKLPDSVTVYSENRGKTVLTMNQRASYEINSDTVVYSATKRWVEQKAGLLQAGDSVSVKFGTETFTLSHLTVENALVTPGLSQTKMPVTTKSMPANAADRLSGSGFLNFTAQILQVPIMIGFFPDGSAILTASYDITKLAPEMQTKYSSLFDKSWNPKNLETTESIFETFEKSFWTNANKVKNGQAKLESGEKVACLTNKNYNFSLNFSLFLRSNMNKDTGDSYGTGGIIFSGSLSGGITEYFLFVAGPVVIPAYVGFEAGISVNTALNIQFAMDKPPAGEENDTKWNYASAGDTDLQSRIEVIVDLSVFGGIGVKGILGINATGYATLDIATILGKGKGSIFTAEPHSLVDLLFGLRFDYYLLFFSGTIKLDCLNKAVRLYDSYNTAAALAAADGVEFNFTDMNLQACADQLIPALQGDTDPAFTIGDNVSLTAIGASTENVDVRTYPDNQAQFAATKNCTALFRILSDGEGTKLVYQLQDIKTGSIEPTVYEVELPTDKSVTEFVVVPNKTERDDEEYCDNVYIGAVLADNTVTDMVERAKTSEVAAMVVNLSERKTISSVIASDPAENGDYLYAEPRPAGCLDYCAVAYRRTSLYGVKDAETLVNDIKKYSFNWASTTTADDPTQRSWFGLGTNQVHSTGVIAPYEPSFWTIDPYRSTDKTLVICGIGANGYYSADDARCRIGIDISNVTLHDWDYDAVITNWQYLNGCNYFLAGNTVYWMDKKTQGNDPTQYQWVVAPVKNGSGLIDNEGRYQMITNNDQSAIYLIGVVEDYQVDVEAGESKKADNRVQISTIINERDNFGSRCTLHGPLSLPMANGDVIENFTAAYNPDSSDSKGLSLLYSRPASFESGTDSDSSMLRLWKQNADRGMRVTNVAFGNPLVTKDQRYFNTRITVRNYGYAVESGVRLRITDGTGRVLYTTTIKDYYRGENHGAEYVHRTPALYTGDSYTIETDIVLSNAWNTNEEQEIRVEVVDPYYPGDTGELQSAAVLRADNTSLTAKNTLVGDKHVAALGIENHTLIGLETPKIKVTLRYADESKNRDLYFSLPTKEYLQSGMEESGEQVYHYDVDMEQFWQDETVLGAYFSLVDGDDVQQSNEVLYLVNPVTASDTGLESGKPTFSFTPVSTTAPSASPTPTAAVNGKTPRTGDDRHIAIWVSVAAVALIAGVGAAYALRKGKQKNR